MDDQTRGPGSERMSGRSDEYISGREALDTDGRIGERFTSRIPSRTPPSAAHTDRSSHAETSLPTSSTAAPSTETGPRETRSDTEHGERSATMDAIQERLRQRHVASRVAETAKDTASSVSQDTAQTVEETPRDVSESEPAEYARTNSIPTAMIGIGLAGVTWVAIGGRDTGSRSRARTDRDPVNAQRRTPYDENGRYYRGGPGRPGSTGQAGNAGEAGLGEAGYPGQGGYEAAASAAENGSGDDRPHRVEYGRGSRSDIKESRPSVVEEEAGRSRSAQSPDPRIQQTSRGPQPKLPGMWAENPLLIGAASAVLGLMVGLAVLQPGIENEYLGEARDGGLEKGQQTVRNTVPTVRDSAGGAIGLVTGEQETSADRGQLSGDQTAGAQPNPSRSPGARQRHEGNQSHRSSESRPRPKNSDIA